MFIALKDYVFQLALVGPHMALIDYTSQINIDGMIAK